MSKEEDKLQENSKRVLEKMAELIANAKGEEEPFNKPLETSVNMLVTKPNDSATVKTLTGIKTNTFLDTVFLKQDDTILDGIPSCSNVMVLGVPNTGKSLLLSEVCLKLAHSGRKVILATSEDAWRTESSRLDLESRYREKAKLLGLDWKKISENLTVLDLVSHAELREFSTFISAFRTVVEKEKAEIFLCDSVTMLEDNRQNIKFRLNEICRYGQNHGLLQIFVSQRASDEPDSFSVAGNLGLIHIVDIVVELDSKKLSSWDKNLKEDTGMVQGQSANFFRVLKNRLSKYNAHFFAYEIDKNGLVKLKPKP